ncbi:hypothetical protein HJC23_005304 [Cyclotella cryptica]|uniref:Uncharacterized protein n=1 Tax=Cyclotella cryptica TaxID=29204 RepID=A0ABD3PHG6_9STRA|eukprot:CCRYP_015077-RA/>CCRYP_015077-RA protein AED:0.04 eAED:0.04 QI:0/-1/0/1/-1/1/1/0/1131
MIDGLNETFFVSVTTPAASRDGRSTPFENDNISPFPTFDEGSLMSSNSVETEKDSVPSVATEVQEEDVAPSVSSSSSDDDDDDYDSTDDESSQPTIPEDIGYVIDATGASLLANLNKKLLEYRYGKDYKFDKVPVQTKIDVDDAVSTMGRMKSLLSGDDDAQFDFQVIPKSPSSVSDKKKTEASPKNREKELTKMIENLTKEDLQVLYKAVMGRDMPVESLDSREDSETGKTRSIETANIDPSPENPLGVPLPSILEESLSGSSADVLSSCNLTENEIFNSEKGSREKTEPVAVEITTLQKPKSSSKLGLLKRILFRKKDKVATDRRKMNKGAPSEGIKRKYSSNNLELQAISVAKSRVSAKSSKDTKEDENSEKKIGNISSTPTIDSPRAPPTEKNEETSEHIVESLNINDDSPRDITITVQHDAVPGEKKELEDVVVNVVKEEGKEEAEFEKAQVEDTVEDPNTSDATVPVSDDKDGCRNNNTSSISPKEAINSHELLQPTVEEPKGDVPHSDVKSVVCEHIGPDIEVVEGAIEINKVPTMTCEAPVVGSSGIESAEIATDQGEKRGGMRFGRSLRGRSKSKSCSPSDEMLQALTADNPVIEIPLSEVKARRSLLSKYNKPAEKNPKTKGPETAAPPEAPKTHHDQTSERKAARLRSPLRKTRKPKAASAELKNESSATRKSPKTVPSSTPRPASKAKTLKQRKNHEARNSPLQHVAVISKTHGSASAEEETARPDDSLKQSRDKTMTQEKPSTKSTETAPEESKHDKSAEITQSSADDEIYIVKDNVASAESDMNGPSLRGWTDDDTEIIEDAGFFCGAIYPSAKDDWLTRIEKSFTQMIDYWDRTPEEAFEESKVYDQSERKRNDKRHSFADDDKSISARSRSSKRRSCGGDRSVRSCSKSRSDKSVRSRSEKSARSRSEKSVKSRSKSRSDKSVKSVSSKSVKPRSKSVNRSTTKLSDATTQEPVRAKASDATSSGEKNDELRSKKVSSEKSASGKSKTSKARGDMRSAGNKTTSEVEALANASTSTKSTSTKRRSDKTAHAKSNTTPDTPDKCFPRSRSSKTNSPTLEDQKATTRKVETAAKQSDSKTVPSKSYCNPKDVREKRASRKNWNNGTSTADDHLVVVM